MKKHILFTFSIFLLSFYSYAQTKKGYKENFTEGDYLLLESDNKQEGLYHQALNAFLEAYKFDSTNSNINYKIGYCYLQTESSKALSLKYLERGVQHTTKMYNDDDKNEMIAPINAYYYYGKALHLNYRFDEAIANYQKFKSYLSPNKNADLIKEVNRAIEISQNAKSLYATPVNFVITNMGDSINSPYPDYSAVISADENTLIFTSRRQGSTGGDLTDDGMYYEDIYISHKKKDGTWTSAVSISPNINTSEHEASVGLIADGQTLLIYKDAGNGDIYSSKLDGENWTFPEPLGPEINNPNTWETSACLTSDGNTIYFVSNRSGGMGGRDIWTCVKLPNGKWSKATNLGPPINTEYDEESPFIHPLDNTLFFSSKGHNTMGGFDIFFSEKTEKGWGEPQNMGYPVNTTDDDLYYVTSPDGKRGYYTSCLQAGGYGEKDIYTVSTPEHKEQALVLIKGLIIPYPGDPMPSDIEIIATNNESGLMGRYLPLMRDGSFVIIIPPNAKYTLSYQQNGEEFKTEDIGPFEPVYQEIHREIHLKHTGKGQPIAAANDDKLPEGFHPTEENKTSPNHANPNYAGKNPISADGELFDKDCNPIKNARVNLLNSKGEVVKSTTTDSDGGFIFTKLDPNDDYTLAAEDPGLVFCKKSKMKYKDKNNKVIAVKNLGNAKDVVGTSPTKGNNVNHEQLAKVDALKFEMHYKYNVTEVDVNDSPFKQYIDNLAALFKTNGSINIKLTTSASQVPTRAFPSNKALSIARADKVKEQLLAGLKDKGVDMSKVIFVKVTSVVSGPAYNTDYLTNKAKYEEFQYSKVSAY